MPWTIDDRFKTAVNQDVVSFIMRHENLSAHDEIAEWLTRSACGLPDVSWYCPDVQSYAYFILHTLDDRIFGIAFGQRALAYRIPLEKIVEAVADGGRPYPDIGDDWVLFAPGEMAGSELIRRWCKIAYDKTVADEAGW